MEVKATLTVDQMLEENASIQSKLSNAEKVSVSKLREIRNTIEMLKSKEQQELASLRQIQIFLKDTEKDGKHLIHLKKEYGGEYILINNN